MTRLKAIREEPEYSFNKINISSRQELTGPMQYFILRLKYHSYIRSISIGKVDKYPQTFMFHLHMNMFRLLTRKHLADNSESLSAAQHFLVHDEVLDAYRAPEQPQEEQTVRGWSLS